jgi:hypothetical protein
MIPTAPQTKQAVDSSSHIRRNGEWLLIHSNLLFTAKTRSTRSEENHSDDYATIQGPEHDCDTTLDAHRISFSVVPETFRDNLSGRHAKRDQRLLGGFHHGRGPANKVEPVPGFRERKKRSNPLWIDAAS